ncbi:MAG: efflux RND transporter periplasmic adaptor subunit [Planctomycetaceae bacterium]
MRHITTFFGHQRAEESTWKLDRVDVNTLKDNIATKRHIGRVRRERILRLGLLVLLGTVFSAPIAEAQSSRVTQGLGLTAFTEPYQVLELAASEVGRIAEVNIKRGSRVKRGDLLCELDNATLQAKRRIAEQRSKSTSRREALEVEHQRLLRRYESLVAISREGGGTPEELADAAAEAKIAELNVCSANEELERAKLEVAEIDAQMEMRRVRATIDGIVTEVHRDAGEYVSTSDPKVATLVDLMRLRASFFLPTSDAVKLTVGNTTMLEFPHNGETVECVVEYIGPLTLADSGRVRVDVVLENADGRYRSGLPCFLDDVSKRQTGSSRSVSVIPLNNRPTDKSVTRTID